MQIMRVRPNTPFALAPVRKSWVSLFKIHDWLRSPSLNPDSISCMYGLAQQFGMVRFLPVLWCLFCLVWGIAIILCSLSGLVLFLSRLVVLCVWGDVRCPRVDQTVAAFVFFEACWPAAFGAFPFDFDHTNCLYGVWGHIGWMLPSCD